MKSGKLRTSGPSTSEPATGHSFPPAHRYILRIDPIETCLETKFTTSTYALSKYFPERSCMTLSAAPYTCDPRDSTHLIRSIYPPSTP